MKNIVVKICFFVLVLPGFSIAQQDGCETCPTDAQKVTGGGISRIWMIFGQANLPLVPVTVKDQNGLVCGTFNPTYNGSQTQVWIINITNSACQTAIQDGPFSGTLIIGNTSECIYEGGGNPVSCNTECATCPTSYTMTSQGLLFSLPQAPPWGANNDTYCYYTTPTGIVHGPFNVIKKTTLTWVIWSFPQQLFPINGGGFNFGGLVQCNYIEGVFNDCIVNNIDECNCPYFSQSPNSSYISLGFQNTPPYAYQDPVELVFNWGTNTTGSLPVNWTSPPGGITDWIVNLNGNIPPQLFTGEIIMNGEIKCNYENSIVISCEVPSFSDDCEKLAECESELENFILNLPGTGCAKWAENCNTTSNIYRFGPTKIGVVPNVPNGYKLAVGGAIITDQAKVELCSTGGWCDYVFSDGYKLRSLPEIKYYIEMYGHLPNTSSSEEIEKNGGIEANAALLNQQEKIEEIYLYLIELNRQVKELKNEINTLEAENSALRIRK